MKKKTNNCINNRAWRGPIFMTTITRHKVNAGDHRFSRCCADEGVGRKIANITRIKRPTVGAEREFGGKNVTRFHRILISTSVESQFIATPQALTSFRAFPQLAAIVLNKLSDFCAAASTTSNLLPISIKIVTCGEWFLSWAIKEQLLLQSPGLEARRKNAHSGDSMLN